MEHFRKLQNEELNRISTEEFKTARKLPIVIVLDNIRSQNNVGSVFRTSDAFRVEKNTLAVVEQLKAEGYRVCSIEQAEHTTSLENFQIDPHEKYAFIFGNEVKGVQQEAIDASDACIEIPQFGTKHSFNIAVTVGIVLWQAALPGICVISSQKVSDFRDIL